MSHSRIVNRVFHGAAVLSIFWLAANPPNLRAQDNGGWRYWAATEGLTEAYCTSVTALSGDRITVRHGDVGTFDILDGYGIRAVPDRHWLGRIYEDSEGTLLTFNDHEVASFRNGSWTTSPVHELDAIEALKNYVFRVSFSYANRRWVVAKDTAALVPMGPGRVLLLVPGRLLEWTRGTGTRLIRDVHQTGLGEFQDLRPAGDGSAWLTGKLGFARISLKDARESLYDWAEVHPDVPGALAFEGPVVWPDKKIFVTARKAGGTRVALTIEGKRSSVIASLSGRSTWLWPGADGRVWKADGKTLGYVEGTSSRDLRASPELAGLILDVLPQRSGNFWMATSQRLAHYTPPLWREVPGAPPIDRLVNSMAEDAAGRMWFSLDQDLLMYHDGVWRTYPLPAGEAFRSAGSNSVSILPEGGVLLDVVAEGHKLIFDPRTARFRKFAGGHGRYLGLVTTRRAGGVWVESYAPSSRWVSFEILENGVYRSVPGLEKVPMADIRDLLDARNGDVWIGASNYLVRVHDGQLHVMTKDDGFVDTGAYALAEMPDGQIYIGGRTGVTTWDGKHFGPLQTALDRARSFAQTKDGTLWVASGTGVYRLSHGEWIGNAAEEGLPGAGYKVFTDGRGTLWAGTTFGLRVFHPEADIDPPVTGISEDRNLRRTPPGGDVKLNFWGVDKWKVTEAQRLLFSYALDGGGWTHFETKDYASFKTLPAGRHTFRVRAMDRNGNVDKNPPSFEFRVLQPLYREPLFLLLLLFAAGAAVFLRVVIGRHGRLRFESRRDPLTGLLNRPAFESALDQALGAAKERNLAVMFIDLDGFKSVNDSLGHRIGDLLLIAVSGRIGSCVRAHPRPGRSTAIDKPALARIGGDEFTVILPGASEFEAKNIAERILEAVRGCTSIEGQSVRISCSIGISIYPTHSRDAARLVRLADLAMYRSKSSSKNCVNIHDSSIDCADYRPAGMAVPPQEEVESDCLSRLSTR